LQRIVSALNLSALQVNHYMLAVHLHKYQPLSEISL
jgi:hypothetical protein